MFLFVLNCFQSIREYRMYSYSLEGGRHFWPVTGGRCELGFYQTLSSSSWAYPRLHVVNGSVNKDFNPKREKEVIDWRSNWVCTNLGKRAAPSGCVSVTWRHLASVLGSVWVPRVPSRPLWLSWVILSSSFSSWKFHSSAKEGRGCLGASRSQQLEGPLGESSLHPTSGPC